METIQCSWFVSFLKLGWVKNYHLLDYLWQLARLLEMMFSLYVESVKVGDEEGWVRKGINSPGEVC